MYLKTLQLKVLKYMNLTLLIFLSSPGLARQACFKKTGVELELLNDINKLLMVENGIRGGICHAIHRYVKANKSNTQINILQIMIKTMNHHTIDANNLYGWGMSQKNACKQL